MCTKGDRLSISGACWVVELSLLSMACFDNASDHVGFWSESPD